MTTTAALMDQVIQSYPSARTRYWLRLKKWLCRMPPDLCTRLTEGWEPRSILELGTGYGIIANYLARRCPQAQVLGVDLNQGRLARAETTTKGQANIRFRHQDILTMEEDAWDWLVMVEVLHHIPPAHQANFLKKSWRLLKPGGRFLIREMDLVNRPLKNAFNHFYDILINWERPHYLPIPTVKQMLAEAGYRRVEVFTDCDRSLLFPHVNYVAYKDDAPAVPA